MNVLSLFDGISCAQVALQKLNIKVNNYYSSEINKNAIKVTQHNFPNTIQLGDITKIKANYLPKIDLIIGGSPCQGFSKSGKQLNFQDYRSKLFFEFVRLLKECKPKYFLFENVKMKKEYEDVISKFLNVNPILINSSLVSAQNRLRLYWSNLSIKQPLNKNIFTKDIIDLKSKYEYLYDWETISRHYSKNYVSFDFRTPMDKSQFRRASYLNNKHVILTCADPAFILCEDNRIRKTTLIEQERLQTLPDNFTNIISNSARHKCLGNSFTVDVIVHILKSILY